jgi:hypothetical protein
MQKSDYEKNFTQKPPYSVDKEERSKTRLKER